MEEEINLVKERPIIIAMKGHPGTGKSTMARAIARTLKCPLIDKDHFRDCTHTLEQSLLLSTPCKATKLLNDLSYEVMWNVISTQLDLGLSVVIDSPLSRRAHLDRLLDMEEEYDARLVIVECKPGDETEWRRRLEARGEGDNGSGWHKPKTWQEIEKLLESYDRCWDYDVGKVPKLVLDTTAHVQIVNLVSNVLQFIKS
ncbi:unnamed protein product [Fraxinus pennsylvanica]|uniref:Uncharacterized protein n=1 Tax=Fraxinus pennsylvanica TaxID=56036 RepID=A0AAD1Z127_9LAMI|nr:unnamed protein product [Fraxinus pennsylvanica]